MTQEHVEPPPILLIKSRHENNLDKGLVKLKLRRDPTSNMLELYESKMAFFDNGDPEEFLLFVRNFNITLVASGTLTTGAKNQ